MTTLSVPALDVLEILNGPVLELTAGPLSSTKLLLTCGHIPIELHKLFLSHLSHLESLEIFHTTVSFEINADRFSFIPILSFKACPQLKISHLPQLHLLYLWKCVTPVNHCSDPDTMPEPLEIVIDPGRKV